MELNAIQRSLAILGTNLLLGTAVYCAANRYHFIPRDGVTKFMSGVAISSLFQATSPFSKKPDPFKNARERDIATFKNECKRDIATFLILGVGAWWAGATHKTTLLSALVLCTLQRFVSIPPAVYTPKTLIQPPDLSGFNSDSNSLELHDLLKEARYLQGKIASTTLKRIAKINILVAESRKNWAKVWINDGDQFKKWPLLEISFIVQLALTTGINDQKNGFLNNASQLTLKLASDLDKCAAFVAIALNRKKLKEDYSQAKADAAALIPAPFSTPEGDCKTAQAHWVAGIDKEEPEVKPIEYSKDLPPMSLAEYHFRTGEYLEALKASHKEEWNLYWRIEFLCRLHGVMINQDKL